MAGTFYKTMFPAGLCSGTNRRGLPCGIRRAVFKCKNGTFKCKYHGGMSTGPKTPEGMARTLAALRIGYAKWRLRVLSGQENRQPA